MSPRLGLFGRLFSKKNKKDEIRYLLDDGFYLLCRNRFEEARVHLEETLAIAVEIDDIPSQGSALALLSTAFYFLNDFDKAIWYREKKLNLSRKIGNKEFEREDLVVLADIYKSLGNELNAKKCFQLALAVAEELGDVDNIEIISKKIKSLYDEKFPPHFLASNIMTMMISPVHQKGFEAFLRTQSFAEMETIVRFYPFMIQDKSFIVGIEEFINTMRKFENPDALRVRVEALKKIRNEQKGFE